MTQGTTRRAELCRQAVLTGIDFVQVADPATQLVLRVFFVIDPDKTVPALAAIPLPVAATNIAASLTAPSGAAAPQITAQRWVAVVAGGITRSCLELTVDRPGGFEPYELKLAHIVSGGSPVQLDPFLSSIVFDFKQACETGFDCREEQDCDHAEPVDFPVDYLARDFESFRRALLDFTAQRYPEWREPIEADLAAMLMEVMAALGDDFAWQQDRHDGEARFGSATQRASLWHHSALADYRPDCGAAASGPVQLTARAGGTVKADTTFWASSESRAPVPFTLDADVWVHPSWNRLNFHNAEGETTCIARGATELLFVAPPPVSGDIDKANRIAFLTGRRALILSDPADASEGRKAWPVTIAGVEQLTDPLILTGGSPTPVLRLSWDASEAVPFDLPVDGLALALNVGTVTAGEKVIEYARAGDDGDLLTAFAGKPPEVLWRLKQLPRLIEREGPVQLDSGARSRIQRIGLAASETEALRFPRSDLAAPVTIMQLTAPANFVMPLPVGQAEFMALFPDTTEIDYVPDLLDVDGDQLAFSVEPGTWRTVRTYQRMGGDFEFRDYAANAGWSVKYAFGDFGIGPPDGTLLRIEYHTDPGLAGNIASFSLGLTAPAAPPPPVSVTNVLSAATNPIAFGNARLEEDARSIRRNAPQAWRQDLHRAVRPEDYSAIAERLDWVQRAYSVTQWTGSWSSDLVSVDPLRSVAITPTQAAEFARLVDCVRLVTRDARIQAPDYIDVDLDISVCVASGFDTSAVLKAVRRALVPPGFFAPDNFTFGQALYRSALEAAVQDVPGVAHVESIRIRVLGRGDWRDFAEPVLEAGASEIIRLQNDPARSTLGLLVLRSQGVEA